MKTWITTLRFLMRIESMIKNEFSFSQITGLGDSTRSRRQVMQACPRFLSSKARLEIWVILIIFVLSRCAGGVLEIREETLLSPEFKEKKIEKVSVKNSTSDKLKSVLEDYRNIDAQMAEVPEEYRKDISNLKKSVRERIDSTLLVEIENIEKEGNRAYKESKFNEAFNLYEKAFSYIEKLEKDASREKLKSRMEKKKNTANETGKNYLKNTVETWTSQAEVFNLEDRVDDAKKALEKAKQEILASKFSTKQLVENYNEIASIVDTNLMIASPVKASDESEKEKDLESIYVDNQDGRIIDKSKKLVWQKCHLGLNNDTNCTGTSELTDWEGAKKYCNSLTLAGKKWRLPTLEELKSLRVCSNGLNSNGFCKQGSKRPTIDLKFFPGTPPLHYWTSTANAGVAWGVLFNDGYSDMELKTLNYHVRCVSDLN